MLKRNIYTFVKVCAFCVYMHMCVFPPLSQVRSPGGPGDPPRAPLELWLADPTTGTCRPALRPMGDSPPLPSSVLGPSTPTPGSPKAGATGELPLPLPLPPPAITLPLGLPYRGLNTVFDDYVWLDDDTIVAAVLPICHTAPPPPPLMPPGPKISDNTAGRKAQNRTYPDLLKVRINGPYGEI